jgi:hypothetical protein
MDELDNVRFSESEDALQEEKIDLAKKYSELIEDLQKEKETILRQMGKENTSLAPLRQKDPKSGYCYFDDISISGNFPYKLGKEEQEVLGIDIPQGAEFCSQECLTGYCKEYKNREKLRHEKERENKNKIEEGKKEVAKIQMNIANLMKRLNKLERKKTQLELLKGNSQEGSKNVGFFRRLGQNLGLLKDNSPRSLLERINKTKAILEMQLDKNNADLQSILISLSVDEQVEKEQKKINEVFQQEKRKRISVKEERDKNNE